ncbi:MAG: GDP-mannose 4,6-dehydratase [Deltaproteobacteria bacterium]|nr:GDP-mannose 4,6-dehydratase [Deltaproteobacteria bacterium]
MSKTALITGIRGQDGAYLAKFLLQKGYVVYGADRRSGDSTCWRLKELDIAREVQILYMDLLEISNIQRVLAKIKPDEIYNLAAQSFVGVSFEQPVFTAEVNAIGTLRILEALRASGASSKFYQASTSEMFGSTSAHQNEETAFHPTSPYAVSKLFAHWMARNYRQSYNMFNCCGILFNHESPLRGLEFVSRKISHGVAHMKLGLQNKLILGSLDSKRDWGFAPEYVEAMYLMMQQPVADDYVIATGHIHSVREFVQCAFAAIDIDIEWEGTGIEEIGRHPKTAAVLVEVSKDFYRPTDVHFLQGDFSKAARILNWKSQTSFEDLVKLMVLADVRRLEKSQ